MHAALALTGLQLVTYGNASTAIHGAVGTVFGLTSKTDGVIWATVAYNVVPIQMGKHLR